MYDHFITGYFFLPLPEDVIKRRVVMSDERGCIRTDEEHRLHLREMPPQKVTHGERQEEIPQPVSTAEKPAPGHLVKVSDFPPTFAL